MSVIDNKFRAQWAMETLRRFDEICPSGLEDDDFETASVDLMVNIFHLLGQSGLDPWETIRRAMEHYLNELDEEVE